jgi:hypothetical protein
MSAKELAGAVYGRFLDHKAEGDFVGMERELGQPRAHEPQRRNSIVRPPR